MSDIQNGDMSSTRFDQPLLSAGEVAELFGVHPSTIRRLARECRVPSYCVGSAPRFVLDEVAAYFRRDTAANRSAIQTSDRSRIFTSPRSFERDRLRAELFD